jgi:nicotinamidase-related amidase
MTARLAELGGDALHVAVDVQGMFLEPTRWQVEAMPSILPNIAALAGAAPGRTIFTRFMPPLKAEDAAGSWRRYYRHWSEFTGEALSPDRIAIVPPLAGQAAEAILIDKATYSAFEAESFRSCLAELRADTLIFSGVETDVCVLATLLDAVDRGFRVVAVADAVASGSPAAHEAVLRTLLPRLADQVEIATTAETLAAWTSV